MSSLPARKSLDERVAEMKARKRDCRTCRAFQADESGLGFGWCTAFEQYVKLYHPAGDFWSQCQFKVITKAANPAGRPETNDAAVVAKPAAVPRWSAVPAPQPD